MSLAQTVFLEHLILYLLLRGVRDGWNLSNIRFAFKTEILLSNLTAKDLSKLTIDQRFKKTI